MKQLTENDVMLLRTTGRVLANETVIVEGDVVVAVNIETGARRVVQTIGLMLEGTRKLLCD